MAESRIGVTVRVRRGGTSYFAEACVSGGSLRRKAKCGESIRSSGKTPTAATAAALEDLAATLRRRR